jgi:hypothetical protein
VVRHDSENRDGSKAVNVSDPLHPITIPQGATHGSSEEPWIGHGLDGQGALLQKLAIYLNRALPIVRFKAHSVGGTTGVYSEFYFRYCGYDENGNLYLTGTNGQYLNQAQLVRLEKGSSNFEQIQLGTKLYLSPYFWPTVQWDGRYLAVTSNENLREPIMVYRLSISGSSGTVIRTSSLTSAKNDFHGASWIQGNAIVGAGTYKQGYENAFIWRYPKGGIPRKTIYKIGSVRGPLVSAVTVSIPNAR